MWLVLELVPTKLPHYTLPLYPALALLAGGAVAAWRPELPKWSRLYAGVAVVTIAGFFGALAPRAGILDTSRELMRRVEKGERVVSPDFREPSLVYLAGTETRLDLAEVEVGDVLVLTSPAPECGANVDRVSGLNYVKGDRLELHVISTDACGARELETWRAKEAALRADGGR